VIERAPVPKLKFIMKWLMGLFFVVAGVNHFLRPDFYMKIMPPYLPWHFPLVYLSGFSRSPPASWS
jgi:uncharacterized membrane protein